ncbi:MAG: GspE/PulE family protein [Parcubacteria group bacterium]
MTKSNLSDSIEDLLSSTAKSKLTGTTAPTDDAPASTVGEPIKTKKGKLTSEVAATDKLTSKLGDLKINEEENAVKEKAQTLGVPYIDLTEFPVSGEALLTVPENICKEQKVVCFVNTGEQIRLATIDPTNTQITDIAHNLEEAQHSKAGIYMISERQLNILLAQYSKLPKYVKPVGGVEVSEEELEKFKQIATDFKELNEQVKKVNTTELVTLIIAAALQARSSDIHVEAEETGIKIRLRVDGMLHDAAEIDKNSWPKVIARIKLLSGLKINITDKPQDGRFTIKMAKERVDVRVSCIPTAWGESVVMRLLSSSTAALQFDDLGLVGKSFNDLKTQTERPNGMIITCGPTGSGKTTTLYAILNKLNQEDVKIITLEDPIEYKLEGINQSQIDHSKGYSFADGLRSILRQDPDIVMVGEIRDLETADIAVNAALTGHLVLSTIHTNDSAGAIPRFMAIGVKPFLLAPSLNAIIGQRLVRKLCPKCKQEIKLEEKDLDRVKKLLEAIPAEHPDRPDLAKLNFFTSKGCPECHGLGFKGRVGIYEILLMSKEIEKVILSNEVSEYQMRELAIKNGMLTMVQDGLIKVLKGITSVEEVFRVAE